MLGNVESVPDNCAIPGEVVKDKRMREVSRLLGVAYCWGVPRGIVLGFGDVGDGMEGGRLSTSGFLPE